MTRRDRYQDGIFQLTLYITLVGSGRLHNFDAPMNAGVRMALRQNKLLKTR